MAELTPMMKQYNQMKAEHPDCILMLSLIHISEPTRP